MEVCLVIPGFIPCAFQNGFGLDFCSFGDLCDTSVFHQKGIILGVLGATQRNHDMRVGQLRFFDRRILCELPRSHIPTLTHYERRSFGFTGHLFGFDISASPAFACSVRWLSIRQYLYKQHTLDHNPDEQESELADYICSIGDDPYPEFMISIQITPAISVINARCFPVISSLCGVPATAGLMRFIRDVSRRGGEVNAKGTVQISTISATKCSFQGTLQGTQMQDQQSHIKQGTS
jgi:hypothetical protein